MPTYYVTVRRTEEVTFALTAESEEDAIDRYLMDGDEIASMTAEPGPEIIDIELAEETTTTD